MNQFPSTPDKQKFKVTFEKSQHVYYESDAIVVKSPSKLHDSPTKKRHTYSTLWTSQSEDRSATTLPTLRGIPQLLPSALIHFDDNQGTQCDRSQGLIFKFPGVLSNRRFYFVVWVVGIIIMMFLSIRSSVSNLSTPSDSGSDIQRQLDHIVHQDDKVINTQSKYDSTSIVSNIGDESIDGIVAASSASDSLTTKNLNAATGPEINEAETRRNSEMANLADNGIESKDSIDVKSFPSPYSVYKRDTTIEPRFAYAYVISGCNEEAPHRNYLYDISISTYLQREAGSTADVVVFIQMAYQSTLDKLVEQDRLLLDAMNIHVTYIPKTADESFYRTMLDKFLILGLVQYERVLFMDGDVLARGNLDYLFDLSVQGILKRNVVTAGKTEPANGGFFMVSPSKNSSDRIMAIIRDKEERGKLLPYPHWDEDMGWGHKFEEGDFARLNNGRQFNKWNFYGAFADQGLLYHWVKYEEKSVSIIYKHSVENWDVDQQGNPFMEQRLDLDIFKEYNFDRVCWNIKPCRTPFKDYMHFTGKSKPWLISPPEGFETDSTSTPPHFWYNTLHVLSEKMKLGIDFSQWRQFHRPLHGLFPTHNSASKTSYASSNDQNETDVVEK